MLSHETESVRIVLGSAGSVIEIFDEGKDATSPGAGNVDHELQK